MSNFLSPGVVTRVFDFSTYIGRVGETSVGMVGGAERGPINVPTLCISPGDFENQFGSPIPDDYGAISAYMYLFRGSSLYYTRIVNKDDEDYAKATLVVSGEDGSDDTIEDVLTLTFKEFGTYGNKFSAIVTPDESNALLLHISIINKDGFVVEQHNVDLSFSYISDDTDLAYVPMGTILEGINDNLEEIKSDYVTFVAEFDETLVTIPAITETLFSGGDNGVADLSSNLDGVIKGLNTLDNPDTVPIDLLVAPGRSEKEVVERMLEICENRHDCFAIIDPPSGQTVVNAGKFHNGDLGTIYPDKPLNSYYGAVYYPWVQVRHPETNDKVWIPPSGVVAGAFSNNDRDGAPWFAPAGLNRAMLPQVIATERELTKDDMDTLYGHVSRAINPIINYKNQGFTIWGQKTLYRSETSGLSRINVARLLLNVRKTVAISSAYVLFDQNDEFTWEQWKGMVEPYLRSVQNQRGLYDFRVIMDNSTVTSVHIDRNQMPGKIALQATRAAEWIVVDFVLMRTGADFAGA